MSIQVLCVQDEHKDSWGIRRCSQLNRYHNSLFRYMICFDSFHLMDHSFSDYMVN